MQQYAFSNAITYVVGTRSEMAVTGLQSVVYRSIFYIRSHSLLSIIARLSSAPLYPFYPFTLLLPLLPVINFSCTT